MAAVSLLLSFISYLTFWAALPVLIFPPLAFYFGLRHYRNACRSGVAASRPLKFLHALPMIISVACFVIEFRMLNTDKWA
jgi:hypothetical protein